MLTRETQMRELEGTIAGLERQVERSSNRRVELKSEIEKQEQARNELNAEQTQAAKEHAAAAAQLARQRDDLERSRQRALALGEDSQSIDINISDVQNAVRESRGRCEQASEKNGLLQEREAGLREQQQQLQAGIEEYRRKADVDREEYQNITIEVQSQRSSRVSATTTLERALSQRQQLTERAETLKTHLSEGESPLTALGEKLQEQLALKVTVDNELRGKHDDLERANDALRTATHVRRPSGCHSTEILACADALEQSTRSTTCRSRRSIAQDLGFYLNQLDPRLLG